MFCCFEGAMGLNCIRPFLAKALTPEELEAELRTIIAEVGAASAKEMGKVMGVASKRLAGRADGKAISAKVKELLGYEFCQGNIIKSGCALVNRHAPICRFCLVLVLWVCYCPRLVTIQSLHPPTIR